jgi:hypothetical protein
MNCLSNDELIRLALDPAVSDEWRGHLQGCEHCAEQSRTVAQLLRQTAAAHHWFEDGHEAGRARLMTALLAEHSPPKPFSLFRRIVMNRRNWFISASAASIVGAAFIVWNLVSPPSLALADALQKFKEAKSFSCKMSGKDFPEDLTIKLTWASPGSIRIDMLVKEKTQTSSIMPEAGNGLVINHRDKTYTITERSQIGGQEQRILDMFKALVAYSGKDVKPSGTDEIDGVKAPRFDLLMNQQKPKEGEWELRVWVHPETKRTLRVDFKIIPLGAKWESPPVYRLEKFEWDIDTAKLFDANPPRDYEKQKKQVITKDEAIETATTNIVTFLKDYKAKVGTYPKTKQIDPAKIGAELDKLGKEKKPSVTTIQGLVLMGVLQAQSKDAVYNGEMVGPDDKTKVLFRWEIDDGNYRVIFGDLRAETVTEEKLKKLEEK